LRESATGMPAVRMSHPLRRICICGPDPGSDSHSHGRALHPSPGIGPPWHAPSSLLPVVRNAPGEAGPPDIRSDASVTMPSRSAHPARHPGHPRHRRGLRRRHVHANDPPTQTPATTPSMHRPARHRQCAISDPVTSTGGRHPVPRGAPQPAAGS
jgi:hypothetical protein